MIKSVTIKNVESHQKTHLKFHPGVNAIIGRSDVGKSGVLRSLQIVTRNTPSGKEYIRHGTEGCLIKVKFDDCIIERKRTKTKNEYKVDGEKLTGFGQHIPKLVETAVNMGDINYQDQMDGPFLIGWSPGQRGEYLSNICGLQDTVTSMSNINTILRTETAQKKKTEESIQDKQKQIDDLPDIDKIETLVLKGESLERSANEIKLEIREIESLCCALDKIETKLTEFKNTSKVEKKIKAALLTAAEVSDEQKTISSIESLIQQYDDIKEQIEDLSTTIDKNSKKLKKLTPDICPLCGR